MVKFKPTAKTTWAAATVAGVLMAGSIATASAHHDNKLSDDPGRGNGYLADQCKNGGWKNLTNPETGRPFKNQGECVSFFVRGGEDHGNGNNNEQGDRNENNQFQGAANTGFQDFFASLFQDLLRFWQRFS